MKENSIEENIKEIECFFKRNYFVNYDWTIIHRNSMANLEDSIEDILSDYKRVLKENERYQKSDYETICLENKELKEINERLESENQEFLYKYGNVLKENKEVKENCKKCIIRDELDEYVNNSIPIKKVKDKIEELNRKIDKSIDNSKGGLDEEFIEKAGELLTQKRILQELLEKEK